MRARFSESSYEITVLLDNGAWDRVGDLLVDGDFYRYEHKQVYAAIGALVNTSRPADVITVYEHLQALGKAEEIGGLGYLNALAQYVPSASNIRRYAEIVHERAVMRQLVVVGSGIAESAYAPNGRDAQQLLDEAEAKIFQIAEGGKKS